MSDGESTTLSSPAVTPSTIFGDNTSSASAAAVNLRDEEIEFDLSNPMDLEVKMSNLTDEEIDELLKQARRVNKELKRELHNAPGSSAKSKSAAKGKSGITKTLPPLRATSGAGSCNLSSSSQAASTTHSRNPLSRKSKTANGNTTTQRPAPKPDWNDRFSL